MSTRYETQRQLIARLLLLGKSTQQIATRVGCTARMVRAKISEPAFQKLYVELRDELFQHIDRRIYTLLEKAVKALVRQLKDPDWRARDSAIEKILAMHAGVIARLTERGTLDPRGSCTLTHPGHPLQQPLDDMTPEQRSLARAFLASMRSQRQPPRRILGVGDDPPGQS